MAARVEQSREVLIWPENWQAWQVFAACATCWRLTPDGRPYGLVMADVRAVIAMLGVEDAADCLERVLVMQQTALDAWAARG